MAKWYSIVALVLVFSCKNKIEPNLTSKQLKTADSLYNLATKFITKHPDTLLNDVYALQLLDKAIAINKLNVNYLLDRGAAKINLLMYKQAIFDFDNVINLMPNNEQAYLNAALCHNQLQQFDISITKSTKAIQINPKLGYAYYIRSESYLYKNDTSSMCKDLTLAMKNNFLPAYNRIFKYCNKIKQTKIN